MNKTASSIAALAAATSSHVAILTAELSPDAEGWHQLLPAGLFKARDGRPKDVEGGHWRMDADIAADLIARAGELGQDILIDYEHQTLNKEKNGQPAPAAGWFTGAEMQWREEAGLFIRPRWTERAAAHIAAGEYRFLSAVFPYDTTGRPLELRMAAITNDPGLVGMEALAALAAQAVLSTQEEESDMDEYLASLLESLRWSLNLPTTSTPQDIQAELQKVIDMIKGQSGGEAVLTSAGLVGYIKGQQEKVVTLSAQLTDKLATLSAQPGAVDLTQFVPVATYNALVEQVASLSAQHESQSADQLIQEARAQGKLLAAEEEYARSLASQHGLAALTSMLAHRAPIAALTQQTPQSSRVVPAATGVAVLTDAQRSAARAKGLTEAQYLAQYPITQQGA